MPMNATDWYIALQYCLAIVALGMASAAALMLRAAWSLLRRAL
jgi:hypothetical protein